MSWNLFDSNSSPADPVWKSRYTITSTSFFSCGVRVAYKWCQGTFGDIAFMTPLVGTQFKFKQAESSWVALSWSEYVLIENGYYCDLFAQENIENYTTTLLFYIKNCLNSVYWYSPDRRFTMGVCTMGLLTNPGLMEMWKFLKHVSHVVYPEEPGEVNSQTSHNSGKQTAGSPVGHLLS